VGKIFNPNRETFLTAEIHNVGLTLPGDGGPPPLLDLFNLTATGGVDCSIIDFDSYGVTEAVLLETSRTYRESEPETYILVSAFSSATASPSKVARADDRIPVWKGERSIVYVELQPDWTLLISAGPPSSQAIAFADASTCAAPEGRFFTWSQCSVERLF
jgi:hypothetical protein